MNRFTKAIFIGTIGTSALLVGTSTAQADPKSSNPASGSSTPSWFAVAKLTGEVFTPSNPRASSPVNPELLHPNDWDKCYVQHDEIWKIASFATSYLGARRRMSIQCGNADKHGYLHIAEGQNNHQAGWRKRVQTAEPRANTDTWDDLMWFAAKSTWKAPELSVPRGSGKLCVSAPIEMFETLPNGSKVLKYTFRPTFIWSMTAYRLITAIETTVPSC